MIFIGNLRDDHFLGREMASPEGWTHFLGREMASPEGWTHFLGREMASPEGGIHFLSRDWGLLVCLILWGYLSNESN